VVANHNHCHAITVQYFEVLRHYAIEQKLTHVQECLFIPLLMSEFDEPKVVRWKDALRPALRDPDRRNMLRIVTAQASFQSSYRNRPLSDAFDAIERRQNQYEGADFPDTTYAAEEVLDLTGDLYISLSLNRPKDKQDEQLDEPAWNLGGDGFLGLLGWGFPQLTGLIGKLNQQDRNRIFDEQIAPEIAEAFIDQLKFLAVD